MFAIITVKAYLNNFDTMILSNPEQGLRLTRARSAAEPCRDISGLYR